MGSNLPLLFKLYKIWSVDSQENHENCCHQMSDFMTKMHQIRFRLGLWSNSISAGALSQSQLGELTALPRPPSWIGGPTSKGTGGKGKRGGKEREGEGLKPPQSKFSGYVAGATEDKEEWRHREMSKTCCTAEDY